MEKPTGQPLKKKAEGKSKNEEANRLGMGSLERSTLPRILNLSYSNISKSKAPLSITPVSSPLFIFHFSFFIHPFFFPCAPSASFSTAFPFSWCCC
jgi:hypothetical protein